MSNEQLMWMSLAIWIALIIALAYFVFKPNTAQALPSGNSADLGNLASTS